MNNQNQTRIISFDIIKLLSAFMVVFYHCGCVNLGRFEKGVYYPSVGQILYALCASSIPLFFMVNGALLLNREYSQQKIYGKAAKIALLILVWSIVSFPSWFFKTLIALYLMYPILVKIYQKPCARYILMCLVFAVSFLYNFCILIWKACFPEFAFWIFHREFSLATLPDRTGFFTMYSIVYFFLGGILKEKSWNPIVSLICFLGGYGMVLFDVIVTSNYLSTIQDAVNGCFPTVGALVMAAGLFTLLSYCNGILNKKVIMFINTSSDAVLPIYLFHLFVRYRIISHFISNSHGSVLIGLTISLLVCVICAIIAKIIKKIPLLRELIQI